MGNGQFTNWHKAAAQEEVRRYYKEVNKEVIL